MIIFKAHIDLDYFRDDSILSYYYEQIFPFITPIIFPVRQCCKLNKLTFNKVFVILH